MRRFRSVSPRLKPQKVAPKKAIYTPKNHWTHQGFWLCSWFWFRDVKIAFVHFWRTKWFGLFFLLYFLSGSLFGGRARFCFQYPVLVHQNMIRWARSWRRSGFFFGFFQLGFIHGDKKPSRLNTFYRWKMTRRRVENMLNKHPCLANLLSVLSIIYIYIYYIYGCFQKLGYPKMDGKNKGTPYVFNGWFGGFSHYFWFNTHIVYFKIITRNWDIEPLGFNLLTSMPYRIRETQNSSHCHGIAWTTWLELLRDWESWVFMNFP